MAGQEINWDRLDKAKFFYVGVGLFSGVTTTLFPLSVIKTRQMASHNSAHAGLAGTRLVARTIWQQEGVRGFYRGFGTVLLGTMPGRTIYMTSLEMAKSATQKLGEKLEIAPSALAGVSSFVAAGVLSGCTSALLTNPLDLVKTRLQVAEPVNGAVPSWGAVLRELLLEEGPRGLLRGVVPRMAASCLWGTCMVSAYEFLKRICALPEPEAQQ
ncbi:hypothetical protein OEZ86_002857 [Tetradesmus obliquus]|nr:hypothetical protein OEZ86_002857 [Tetradesmus obliquus]